MSRCRQSFLWFVAGLMLLPLRAPATTVEAPDFNTLVKDADYVVHAVVKSVTPEWREHEGRRYIATRVGLEVREVIKGTPPSPLVLDVLGGRIGDDELVVEGVRKFLVGDEDILFVQGNGRLVYPLVAMMHGRYPILRDAKTGVKYAVRSNGMPLYSEQDVALPMTRLSPAKEQNAATRPMTADTFAQKVRTAVDRIAPQPSPQK